MNRARDENNMLFQFWKDNISSAYKKTKGATATSQFNQSKVSAVPSVNVSKEHQFYASCFELDVALTIE